MIKYLIPLLVWISFSFNGYIYGYNYEVRKNNGHVIHLITISPEEYKIELIKSRNNVIGRETVPMLAERSGAIIAINAGFFEIGDISDGRPSGTLVANDKIYGLKFDAHPVFSINSKGIASVKTLNPKITLQLNDENLYITKINQPPSDHETVIFSNAYSESTLTPYKKRKEIAFNQNGEVMEIYEHGDALIPSNGFVVSLPNSYKLENIKKESIKLIFGSLIKGENYVYGIPRLLEDGEIYKPIFSKTSTFYKMPHARTAIGIKEDGTVLIILAEHLYKKDLTTLTYGEIYALLRNNKYNILKKYHKLPNSLTMDEVNEFLKQQYQADNNITGLSILELAEFMKKEGCKNAINLDGGGSSTLWINGKVVNQITGDEDEGNGLNVLRPVSDAIIIKEKIK